MLDIIKRYDEVKLSIKGVIARADRPVAISSTVFKPVPSN